MFTAPHASFAQGRPAGQLYRQIAVESQLGGDAGAHRLVTMLFDGLLESLAQARGAMRAGRVEDKARAISRAARIVDEGLRASLDLSVGGELAQRLHALYGYVTTRLTQANLRNDEAMLDECVELIHPLASAWSTIDPAPTHHRNA